MLILLTFVLLILLALSVFAQTPKFPSGFYGTSKVNGIDTPTGTGIIAKVSGDEKGRYTTKETGKYGAKENVPSLLVYGDDAAEGSTIEFYVSRVKATQTGSFKSGKKQELNLSWLLPSTIEFPSGNLANEPILCLPGVSTKISNSGLNVEIKCSNNTPANLANISNLGRSFLIGVPTPSGVLNISDVFEISVTGNVEIIVTISYNDAGIDESTVTPYKFAGGVWTPVPSSDIISRDTAANRITFKVAPGGTPYTTFGSAPAPPPAAPAPTGVATAAGGGGECTYDWQCTAWSECSPNGKQTRTCTNRGTCTDNLGKPSETQDCVYTAPKVEEEIAPIAPPPEEVPEVPEEEPVPATGFVALTGAVASALSKPSGIIGAIIVLVLVGAALYAGYYNLYRKKEE